MPFVWLALSLIKYKEILRKWNVAVFSGGAEPPKIVDSFNNKDIWIPENYVVKVVNGLAEPV